MTAFLRVLMILLAGVFLRPVLAFSVSMTTTCETLSDTGLSGVSINIVKLFTGSYRAYYMGSQGMVSATSSDTLTWTQEEGSRISSGGDIKTVSNPWVFITKDGNFRMIYEGQDNSGNRRLYSAKSSDGLNFTKEGMIMEGTSEDKSPGKNTIFLSVPSGIRLKDNSLRMYFVSDGSDIRSATSTDDGLTWTRDSGTRLTYGVDPAALYISNNNYVMFYTDWSQTYKTKRIHYATSTDGLNFTTDSSPVISITDSNSVVDPEIVITGDGRARLLFSVGPSDMSTSTIYSCLLPETTYKTDICNAALSSALELKIPVISVDSSFYQAKLTYRQTTDSNIWFKLTGATQITDTSSYSTCEAASLSTGFKLHIPNLIINTIFYWADLQYAPDTGNDILFKVLNYGMN